MELLVDSCVFIDAFDPKSSNHFSSFRLLEDLRHRNLLITMPAHAWFEIKCTFQRLSAQGRFKGPVIAGQLNYPIRLIHIDRPFIEKYAMIAIPYIKGGDHIFLAIAKHNGYPLVTSDMKLIEASRQCEVAVFTPDEFLAELAKVTIEDN